MFEKSLRKLLTSMTLGVGDLGFVYFMPRNLISIVLNYIFCGAFFTMKSVKLIMSTNPLLVLSYSIN